MQGGLGNDYYTVDNLNDLVVEFSSSNTETDLVIALIDYTLGANVENLRLDGGAVRGTGNSLNNNIRGTDINNILDGRDGNDFLRGYGGGKDTWTGGNDADIFALGEVRYGVYYEGDGYTRITDFDRNESDKIQLLGSSSDYSLSVGNWAGGNQLDTLVHSNGDTLAVVEDVSDLTFDQDFQFV